MSVQKRQRAMLQRMFDREFRQRIAPEKHAEVLALLLAEFPEGINTITRTEFTLRVERLLKPHFKPLTIERG